MMLNWFVSYCNYYGYYFNDNNYNYNNYSGLNQNYTPPVRRLQTNKNANGGGKKQKELKQQQQQANGKAIEEANLKKGLETKIEQGNKGYDILLKMGYQDGQGLGKNGGGIMKPLAIVNKQDRQGLAAAGEEKKNIPEAGLTRRQRKRAINGRRQANSAAHEAHMAKELAEKATKAAEKAVEAAERAKKVADNIKSAKSDNNSKMEVEEVTKPRRKHSPIRAPSPTPTANKTSIKATCKQNVVPAVAGKIAKDSFSIKDPVTPEFLRALARCFRSEIELMQLRLQAAASSNPLHASNELIVAKIVIGQNHTIAEHAFEFIRTDLVGWIGVYQEEGMDTPIFHSMTNNVSHITVVCDNDYAYNCLAQCIDDITQMKTMGSVKVVRLPPITPLIYCFDAIYEGVARDSALFLTQIHLHKSKLYSDNWVVVSHEVCPEERRTYFIFLIDERSALALNFHYSRNLFICMQQVTFRNRGIVTDEYLN